LNIVLLDDPDWIDDQCVQLRGRRQQHLIQVLGVSVGSTVKVGQLGGLRGLGTVISTSTDSIQLRVTLDQPPSPRHPFTLVLGLPRPKMLRRVLRTCAEFGVADVHLIHSRRVEKSFWQSPLLTPAKIREALQAGLERSGDTVLPQVTLHHRFRPFVEDQLQTLADGRSIYIAHPGDYPQLGHDSQGEAVVMIGPEGGFIPFEIDLAGAQGVAPRAMGSRILSVDTAVTAALARVWI